MSTNREREIEWYQRHGKYPERIIRDRGGGCYVVGDHSWNLNHRDKIEYVEQLMNIARVYDLTEARRS